MRKRRKKPSFIRKVIISLAVLILLFGILYAHRLYSYVYQPNITLNERAEKYIYIPTSANFKDVISILSDNGLLINSNSFEWVADRKNYKYNIKAGRYFINRELNNNELINLLRSGAQAPLNIKFHNLRTKEEIAGIIGMQIETDSISIISFLNDSIFLDTNSFTKENIACIFIPNTYEFYWNTSAKQFVKRMLKEYEKFWNKERLKKAVNIGLTKFEVITLASIVEMESYKKDERPIIARLYLNRLKKRMKLQSDPTIIFAIGDFSIRRVLTKDLKIKSPYNTYLHKGLPPGPICIPSINAIDAVLNASKNDYIFMCAKEDFSGYHNFAKTSREHSKNARKYRRALNKRKIMR
ncbi:MAG: endolytic transglycosylase MltG [Flavobacteriales bacterium]|nr:endolytic transglycosylase MltG [Flavobacteriales bacterium]